MTLSPQTSSSVVFACVSIFLLQGSPAFGEDWPQWRGPLSDGVSRETGLSTDWRKELPPVVWQRPLGLGFSSFSAANDRLYTLAVSDNAEFVFCLDAKTGETIWKVPSGSTHVDPQGGDGPRSTPTVVDDVVYSLGAQGYLWCLDNETGEVRWRRNVLDDFGGKNLQISG